MRRRWGIAAACLMILFAAAASAMAAHGSKGPDKKGILLVAFGSSVPAAQVSFANIEQAVKKAFPGVPLRWAYTSKMIRHKLAKEGKQLDSVEMALSRMMDEGFTHVAVQSFHTIPGEEFHDTLRVVNGFRGFPGGFTAVALGPPMLASDADFATTVDALLAIIPKERKPEEAVVFMGHGTAHPANAAYAALQYHLHRKDPLAFMGTVEGAPTIDDIQAELTARKVKKAYLHPFLSVAGDHTVNDMAGDEEDSWKSILTGAGITCVPILKGTAEYDEILSIWVDHLRQAVKELEGKAAH